MMQFLNNNNNNNLQHSRIYTKRKKFSYSCIYNKKRRFSKVNLLISFFFGREKYYAYKLWAWYIYNFVFVIFIHISPPSFYIVCIRDN